MLLARHTSVSHRPLWLVLLPAALLAALAMPAFHTRAAEPQNVSGNLIAFVRPDTDSGYRDIFTIDVTNRAVERVTNTRAVQELHPDWSPDGTTLAFEAFPSEGTPQEKKNIDVYTMSVFPAGPPDNLTENNLDEDREPSWVARGIAFDTIRPAGASHDIYTMSSTGENQTKLFGTGFPEAHPSWSPDGAKVVFSRRLGGAGAPWELIMVRLDDPSNPVALTNTPQLDECTPSWAPDSRWLAFQRGSAGLCEGGQGGSALWVMDTTNPGAARAVTQVGVNPLTHFDGGPTWSPDMTMLAFARKPVTPATPQERDYELYMINLDGGNLQQLTNNSVDDRQPDWQPKLASTPPPVPPVSNQIVYQGTDAWSGEPDLFVVGRSGGTPMNLTNTPGQREYNPSWSPDGTQIAYHRNPTTNQAATNIYTIFLDLTGTPAQVTTDPGQDRDPSWVASGIAFETLRPAVSDTYEIFTTSAAGGTERNLTNSAFSDNHPAWSEDGTRVAFQRRLSRPGGAQWDIVVIDVASGAEINLTTSADADECMPAWSADGSKLAFYKGAPGACDTSGASTVASDIWVMERNGGNPRQLTSNAQRNVDPAWSPDGTRIAWSSNRDGDYEIYVMQASGAGVQQFTFNNTPDMAPDWQPGSGSNSASDVRVFLPLVAAP